MKPAQNKSKSKTKTKTKRSNQGKKPRRKLNVPKVVYGAEPERPEPGKEFDLKELARLPHHRIVEFPQMKGRTVQRIRFYSSSDENTVAIRFRDRTQLSFSLEPALVLRADLLKMHRWDTETIKEWPPIHSEPRNPNR
jgi:hypothetical protein